MGNKINGKSNKLDDFKKLPASSPIMCNSTNLQSAPLGDTSKSAKSTPECPPLNSSRITKSNSICSNELQEVELSIAEIFFTAAGLGIFVLIYNYFEEKRMKQQK